MTDREFVRNLGRRRASSGASSQGRILRQRSSRDDGEKIAFQKRELARGCMEKLSGSFLGKGTRWLKRHVWIELTHRGAVLRYSPRPHGAASNSIPLTSAYTAAIRQEDGVSFTIGPKDPASCALRTFCFRPIVSSDAIAAEQRANAAAAAATAWKAMLNDAILRFPCASLTASEEESLWAQPISSVFTGRIIRAAFERIRDLCADDSSVQWKKLSGNISTGAVYSACAQDPSGSSFLFPRRIYKMAAIVATDVDTAFDFLKESTRPGGRLDYFMRGATVAKSIESAPLDASWIGSATSIEYVDCAYTVPLPGIRKRRLRCLRTAVNAENESGVACSAILFTNTLASIAAGAENKFRALNEFSTPSSQGKAVIVYPSGFVVEPCSSPSSTSKISILVDVNPGSNLNRIVSVAYRSGIVSMGLKNVVSNMIHQLRLHVERCGLD